MNIKRHVGRIKSTDRRCVVVMMQLQDENGIILDPNNAMIIDTDSLPDRLQQPLLDIVDSAEGQNETVLARLLARRSGPESGVDIFTSLCGGFNGANYVRKISVNDVVMYPAPNNPVPLSVVLEAIGSPTKEIKVEPKPMTQEEKIIQAKALLLEAQDLQELAYKKIEEAWELDPSLKPLEPAIAVNHIEGSDGAIEITTTNVSFDAKTAKGKAKKEVAE
jgi:hypothetical protein